MSDFLWSRRWLATTVLDLELDVAAIVLVLQGLPRRQGLRRLVHFCQQELLAPRRLRVPGMSAPACSKCGGAAVVLTEKDSFSIAGVFGAFVFLVGGFTACLVFTPVGGFIVALLGIAISVLGSKKYDALKCTLCGFKRRF